MKKKAQVATGVIGIIAMSGLISFLIYRYCQFKDERQYDDFNEEDVAWG